MIDIDYAMVLRAMYPGAEYALIGNSYDTLRWLSDTPKPTEQELEAAWPQVQIDMAWRAIRTHRDAHLSASDWTQVADAPVDASSWAVYRQALRDLPQDFASPDEVIWPLPPS